MNNKDILVEDSKYKPSFTTTTIILTSLLNAGLATTQISYDNSTFQSNITYEKGSIAPSSNSLIGLNEPTDSDIITGLIDIHENLLSHQEYLDNDLQSLLYENIDDLYA